MSEEQFGNIMYDGKIVNLDKEKIELLEEISKDLKSKRDTLKRRAESIFKQ